MNWLVEKFELTRDGGTRNVRPMEGTRGFAVFLVFLVHYATLIKPWIAPGPDMARLASTIHAVGNTGVDLFFVLSGFLIYGTLISRSQNFGRFMWRRVRRIYPTFIAVFAAYTALSFIFRAENKIPAGAVPALLTLAENFLLLPVLVAQRGQATDGCCKWPDRMFFRPGIKQPRERALLCRLEVCCPCHEVDDQDAGAFLLQVRRGYRVDSCAIEDDCKRHIRV